MRNRKPNTRFTTKIVPLRTCIECGDTFTPKFQEQKACGRDCGRKYSGRQDTPAKKARLLAASRARREQKNRAIQAELRQQWGELSVREIDIFKFASRIAFRRGQSSGRALALREMKLAAQEAAS